MIEGPVIRITRTSLKENRLAEIRRTFLGSHFADLKV